jgi:DNA-binding PadR family transcriptional regulator
MADGQFLGQFEQVVLTAVLSLREHSYGVRIHTRVNELSAPKSASLGAVYVTLDRLEDKGFVRSWLSEPTRERGGRAKRCYELEALGEHALRESAESVRRLHDVLSQAWVGRTWKPARIR